MAEAILGAGFVSVVVSDFYGAYTGATFWRHAYCGAHNIREVKKIAELAPSPLTERFRDTLRDLYAEAKQAQQSGDAGQRHGIRVRLGKLIANESFGAEPDLLRMQARLEEHFYGGSPSWATRLSRAKTTPPSGTCGPTSSFARSRAARAAGAAA